MDRNSFQALVVRKTAEKKYESHIETRSIGDLPEGDVLVKVHYSSLNYKDALSAIGNKGVTRHYPHTPGIDAAGEVAACSSGQFAVGEPVLVTGHDLGMDTDGGFGGYIRVPAEWVLPLPGGMTLKQSMMYGTAGFTAALSLYELEAAGITPRSGDILVTGASGGVGSLAVGILSGIGYPVVAVTGKPKAQDMLGKLGAKAVVDRDAIVDTSQKALLKGRFAGAIDTVGAEMLSSAIRSVQYGGAVTCCGNAASGELHLTVYPFILRALRLIGIESVACPMPLRREIWNRLAGRWAVADLSLLVTEIDLNAVPERLDVMLKGGHTGRCVVNVRS